MCHGITFAMSTANRSAELRREEITLSSWLMIKDAAKLNVKSVVRGVL